MIEIMFLVYFLPKRMSILARERDRSGLKWALAAIGAWLGMEILINFTWGVVSSFGLAFWDWSEATVRTATVAVYVIGLVGGMVSADVVRRLLTAKPVVREVKQWKGIWG
jgi:hypothetical protein